MKIIHSTFESPFFNFSLEELLLKEEKLNNEDLLLIYQNNNAIIVGKNQNTHEEINSEFVKQNKITVARRLSGGGAVYQDKGNINFCFITKNQDGSYAKFLKPIIEFLKTLGLDAQFSGKNDVLANGYKISGNAQYKYKNRMFHHGTLLFDSKMETLAKALKPNPLKFESKSVKSVRKRVTNIKKLINKDIDTKSFINLLIDFFVKKGAKLINQNIIEENKINDLAKVKSQNEWNFGKNPPFDIEVHKRFDGGTIKIKISAHNDKIKNIRFEGDFMSNNDFENIYNLFIDKPFDLKYIKETIDNIKNFSDYFGKITKDEILSLFIESKDNKHV